MQKYQVPMSCAHLPTRLRLVVFLAGLSFLANGNVVCLAQVTDSEQHIENSVAGLKLFRSDVRTLLAGRCLKCHGGEETDGGLNLATREGLLLGGDSGKAIDFETPGMSLLVKLVQHTEEPFMPEDGAKLDDDQIAVIERWIELGAPYDRPLLEAADSDPVAWTQKTIPSDARDYWAFRPLMQVEPPALIAGENVSNEVDQFIIASQRVAGVVSNPTADRRTLIRRGAFDLIGLPPTAEQVEQFVIDSDPRAWEKQVDLLLASKHYGERWGRHWLDLARFAESFGFEQDYDRPHAYHYRDFVIEALNNDMPYDQFAAWQIAGDELAPDNPQAWMATGFLGAGVFPTQLTEKEFESARYDELDDMVSTLGTTFLGFTVGCARCHDHKFDPIPSRDYYQLISVFGNAIRSNVEIPIDADGFREKLEKWQEEHELLTQQLAQFESVELPSRFSDMVSEMRNQAADSRIKLDSKGWNLPESTQVVSEAGATFQLQDDGSFLATGTNGNQDRYQWTIETLSTRLTGLRLDALADPSLPHGGPGRAGNGNIGLSHIQVMAQPLDSSSPATEVRLVQPVATFQQNESNLSIAATLDDQAQTGWAVDPQFNKSHAVSYRFESPLEFAAGVRLTVVLTFQVNGQHNIGRPRISLAAMDSLPPLDAAVEPSFALRMQAMLEMDESNWTREQKAILVNLYKVRDERWNELNQQLVSHLAAKPSQPKLTAMVCSEGVKPIPNHGDDRGYPHFYKETFFLKRGDVTQKQGPAPMGFVQALTRSGEPLSNIDWTRWRVEPSADANEVGSTRSYRRASLAKWLTDTHEGAGQQLARVIVNRIWQYHFGQGLVSTPNDFGFQGERPTHPELLDWLAKQLIDGGWRIKPIHRLIMTSATYQQSSSLQESCLAIDPTNRLLWRFQPRRLEAEVIRDAILATSGELDDTMFGPGTLDATMKRRSIYFFIKRSQLIPFMQVFDSPEPLVGVGQRPSTTIAPQALMLMNSPQVREWAIAFASRLMAQNSESLSNQINNAYLSALGRLPNHNESVQATDFVTSQMNSYLSDHQSSAGELALADFCQILFSLNEFVYIE
jgi:mono/diheme cytochrome c family protein